MLKERFTNWWMPAIIGIIAIILGITILGNPDITLLFIIKYLGLSLGITGIIVVASNYSKKDSNNGTFWIWEGILNIIIGIFIFNINSIHLKNDSSLLSCSTTYYNTDLIKIPHKEIQF